MSSYQILDSLKCPEDLKQLTPEELDLLCDEIRDFLIQSVSQTGGHLASNLGVVELTVALHRVFDSPKDSFVWDVGHQSYTHKILTGRKNQFSTLRQKNGLSGFPKPRESKHDVFTTGHSSTSVSVAYAISRANQLSGDPHHAVAIIGDGAFTGGMAYEALNNAGRTNTNLVIVLNHNSMSISRNVGAFARYLAVIRAKPGYLRLKQRTEWVLDHTPLIGQKLKETLQSSKSLLKYLLYHATFFEELGFAYFGPVDGHNLEELEQVLQRAKDLHKPAIVFVETVKGKGYEFAERNPPAYHGISRFDIETGNPDIAEQDSFSSVFGERLSALAAQDHKICAITAAMKYGTGLTKFASDHRQRFFDVGIAEQHAVTFAAGLSVKGFLPVVAVYSTFLQRAYDQILHDAAIDGRHILLAVDHAGIAGADGETHQGIYDVAFLTSIPGVTIYAPSTYRELEAMLEQALYRTPGVVALRYPKGSERTGDNFGAPDAPYHFFQKSYDRLAISYGKLFSNVWHAAEELPVSLLKLNRITPLEPELYESLLRYREIWFFEEAEQSGSISEHLAAALLMCGFSGKFRAVTLPNGFIPQASVDQVLDEYQLSEHAIHLALQNGSVNDENKA